jgi:O-acetyl-ADP-ribose deacetylase (regulator of RNase III)
MEYIEGDLIKLALEGKFDVIAHGCNCFCTMGAGIAPQMAETFGCDNYPMESIEFKGGINKLGQIDYDYYNLCINSTTNEFKIFQHSIIRTQFKHWDCLKILTVINAYTQYNFKNNSSNRTLLDYEALTLCMRKINHIFKGQHIGLPQIGCGLAGGDWDKVKNIIETELCDCNVTIVKFKK